MHILYATALSLLNVPYKWGGATPIEGLDCSGLTLILLRSSGERIQNDTTAQGLFNYYSNGNGEFNRYEIGALAFYGGSASKVTHVAMLLDRYRIIEAGGGGPTVTNLAQAIKEEAFVRIRTVNYRADLVAVIKPYYRGIGMR